MLYLIRHCSTIENESGILCSDKDFKLSDKGIEQGKKLSTWFCDKKIDLILSSSLLRAEQTAKYINEVTNAEIVLSKDLLERKVSPEYTNLKLQEITECRINKEHNFYDPTQDWNDVIEVESDMEIFERVKSLLINFYNPGINIACVTHAGVIKAFLHIVLKMDKRRSNGFKVKNGCVIVLQNENDFEKIQILGINQLY